nr:MAG TPA: hypothetical protein [Caudoviricetes sp.]
MWHYCCLWWLGCFWSYLPEFYGSYCWSEDEGRKVLHYA